jgi:hypothetical protein
MTISIIIGVVIAIILILLVPNKKVAKMPIKSAKGRAAQSSVEKNNNVIDTKNLKMMSYEEALKASKAFLYNIARAVIRKFTPGAQQELLDAGRNLSKAGMKYIHVVDIFALSVEKSRGKSAPSTPAQDKGKAKGVAK